MICGSHGPYGNRNPPNFREICLQVLHFPKHQSREFQGKWGLPRRRPNLSWAAGNAAIARGGNIACDLEIMRCRISILHKRYAGQNNKATASEETGPRSASRTHARHHFGKSCAPASRRRGDLSMRALATLGVQSRTIHSHFKGGLDELGVVLAQKALADVARPLKPRDTPVNMSASCSALFWRRCTANRRRQKLSPLILFQSACAGTHPRGANRSRGS
jgi:hypothetical protein